ncbi:lytic transglycosylase domain-containing protein, partial [bacterium LRH843]|nr:lytic transglycosylase domain-containing protein [bacterium LRH843]
DMLLWQGETALAEQMMAKVESGARALAAARLALRAGRSDGINALIDAVPAQYADDAGLAFERFRWRVEAGLWDGAREMILARSNSQD